MPARKHRRKFFEAPPCPKCGDRVQFPPYLCGCGWENRSETRRGNAPNQYSTGCHKIKLAKQHKKRQRRNQKKATDRLIKAVLVAATQEQK